MQSLHQATMAGDLERARELLAQGHDVNARDHFEKTPLHVATFCGSLDMVRFLADHGADLEARNRHGWTPLFSAIYAPNSLAFGFLLSRGADFNSIQTPGGNTPLHLVGSIATAKCLIEYGFDPSTSGVQSTWMCPTLFSTRNNEGKMPHKCAKKPLLRKALAKYLDSFESLPLVDLTTMKLSTDMNDFQRFLARRIYYTTLCKISPGQHVAVLIMAFLSPADVMK